MDRDRAALDRVDLTMARRPPRARLVKALAPEKPSTLGRLASIATDWKTIVAFVLLLGGGVAWAIGLKFATKAELATVKTDVQVHNEELAGIHQAISDFANDQKQMMDWVRDIYQHPRK